MLPETSRRDALLLATCGVATVSGCAKDVESIEQSIPQLPRAIQGSSGQWRIPILIVAADDLSPVSAHGRYQLLGSPHATQRLTF